MASLGQLVVSLSMDTAKFVSAAGKSQQHMLRLAGQAGKMGAAIGAAMTAAAGGAAAFVKSAIDAADATAKAAQAAGTSVEAYSQLAYAAELSGVSADGLGTALKKLAKGAADARAGTGEAKDAFRAMGISVTDSAGALKSQEQLLSEVADKFASYADGAEKTALAQRLFGKSGAEMIPLLNNGSAGIAKMRDESIALGASINTSAGKAAEQFKDNLTRLGAVAKGLANRVAQQLLPTLVAMTNRLVEAAKSSGLLDQAARAAAAGVRLLVSVGVVVAAVFKTLGQAVGGVFAAIAQLVDGRWREAWSTAQSVVFDFADNVRSAVETVREIWDTEANAVATSAPEAGKKMAAPIIATAAEAKKQGKAIERIVDQVESRLAAMQFEIDTQGASDRVRKLIELTRMGASAEQLQRYLDLAAAQEQYRLTVEAAAEADRRRNELLAEGARLTEQLRTPVEQYGDTIMQLNELLNEGAISWETYSRAIEAAQQKLTDATKKTDTLADNARRAAERIQDALGDSLASALDGNFKDIFRNFAKMLSRMVAEAAAADIMHALFGRGTGGNVAGLVNGVLGMFRANGGPVRGGSSYIVGERGPELFRPASSGYIVPNHQLGGGTSVVLSPTIYIDSRSDRAQVAQMVIRGMQESQRSMWAQLKARGIA